MNGGEQHRADADALEQVVHDGSEAGLVGLVLGERQGAVVVDILVGALDAT